MFRDITTPEGFNEAVLVILSPETPRMILMEVEKPVMLHFTPENSNGISHATPMGPTLSLKIFVKIGDSGVIDILRYILAGEEENIIERLMTYNGRYMIEWADGDGPASKGKDRIPYSLISELKKIKDSCVKPNVAEGIGP